MKRKQDFSASDNAAHSSRFHTSPEQRAAAAAEKAEALNEKLEQARSALPKQRRLRLQRQFDAANGRVRHTLHFEEEVRPRGKQSPVTKTVQRAERSAGLTVHSKLRETERENVGVEAAHKTEFAAEQAAAGAARRGWQAVKDQPYRAVDKLEIKSARAGADAQFHAAVRDNPELQQRTLSAMYQRRKLKRDYAKAYREAQRTGSRSARVMNKAKDVLEKAGQAILAAAKNHKGVWVAAGILALLVTTLSASLSSCSVSMEGAMSAILGTSYTSEDPDILQVESNYTALEKQLERRMANIESEYPGYDEYRYDVDTIGHDPNVLISYLTTKFNAFTPAQVQAELQALFDGQYTLTTSAVTEIRYRTVTWTDEDGVHSEPEAYEYHILYVTLRNNQLETVVSQRLTDDERPRYAATLQFKGNKPYLFGGDIYANPSEGAQYQVPGEALSDPFFAALIEEAEKYLGFPYVWGGSTPETSFDCSGFVCWVYTHSGVYDLPRTTATGIYNQCAAVSPDQAKPGDLIFFTKTYDCVGPVSHVGIYVGDGMMIHCGSPIKYASINTSYWQEHFYAFGRLS